jgi:antitoxin HigA-1
MKPMFNPPHPGEALREDVLPALGLSVSEAARQLGVSRVALSRVLHGRAGISVDLARRLEAWLATEHGGPTAESFLREQAAYDLWQLKQSIPLPTVQRARAGEGMAVPGRL